MCSQSSIQTTDLRLPFVLKGSFENFVKPFEAAAPDAMCVFLELPPQGLPFLLVVPKMFESSHDCFSLHGVLLRWLISSRPHLSLSLLGVLLLEDIKQSAE